MKDDELRAALRARLLRLAGGSAERADEMLDRVLGGWDFDDCAQLVDLLPFLTLADLDPDVPLFWLYVTLRVLDETPAGRGLIAFASPRH